MRFELTNERLQLVHDRLAEGKRLRKIADELNVSESVLRWHLAQSGYRLQSITRLVPIHAAPLDQSTTQAA